MTAGRPNKYHDGKQLSIYFDRKDLEFLDDHRGGVSRGEYLREAMYSLKGDISEKLRTLTEKIKQQSEEINGLNRKLFFEQSKNKKHSQAIEINESGLINFYDKKDLTNLINKHGSSINWQNIFDKNIGELSVLVNDYKELQKWCMDHFRNNGTKEAKLS